jgi:hypothetical protein
MSNEFPAEPFLTAAQAVAFLNNELGIPTSKSSFAKETMPSRATGPIPTGYWGKRPLWTPSRLRLWAAARLQRIQQPGTVATDARRNFPKQP